MMERMVVWKYRLPQPDAKTGRFGLTLPPYASVFAFGVQGGGDLVVWAYHDPTKHSFTDKETRYFILVNTGMDVPVHRDEKLHHIGTTTVPVDSPLYPDGIVWHLFEVVDEPF